MGIPQTDLINEAEGYLSKIAEHVRAQVAINHQDVLIGMEPFFCELLNLVYGWKLTNDNLAGGSQQDSFDLSDREARIAVQVTCTTTPAKIRKTLKAFVGKHDSQFNQLLFVYPQLKAPASEAKFEKQKGSFDFVARRDRFDFQQILLKARSLSLARLSRTIEFLRNSLPTIVSSTNPVSNVVSTGLVKTSRVFRSPVTKTLFGREDVVHSLLAATGDQLIVGQPGIGKTAVLSTLVEKVGGYFLQNTNEVSLKAQLIAVNPKLLAIEDAHLRLNELRTLRIIRDECALQFRILADCWKSHLDELIIEMELQTASVIELQPISNTLIIAMAKEYGISGPDRFFHHLVRQSMGFPGRAAMLLRCCRGGTQEDVLEFFKGDSIARWTRQLVQQSSNDEAMDVLSCLALGRDLGIELSLIANYLEISLAKVQRTVTEFSAGGLVEENRLGGLIVFPEAMRPALIRDFFFGEVRRSLSPFASNPRLVEVVAMAAVDAYCVGAKLSIDELFQLTRSADTFDAWKRLAVSGDSIADRVLDEKPDFFDSLLHVFIERIPERTICRLIMSEPESREPFNHQSDRFVQTVKDWAKRGYPMKQAISRRRTVLDAIANQLSKGTPADQVFRFLGCVFTPEYKSIDQSPENFDTLIWRSGLLAPDDLRQLREFWPETRDLLKRYPPNDWSQVVEAVKKWLWPCVSSAVNDDQREQIRLAAEEILEPLCELAVDSAAALTKFRTLAEYHEVELSPELPADYEVVFPREYVRGRNANSDQRFREECFQKAVKLGLRWSQSAASEVLAKLKLFNEDATQLGHAYPNYSDVICKSVSQSITNQSNWINEAIRLKVPSLVLQPFLRTACEKREEHFDQRLADCFNANEYRHLAIPLLLHFESMPKSLVKAAILASGPYAEILYGAALRNEIALAHYSALLSHSDQKLRGKVAEGLWSQDRRVPTDSKIRERWRTAIAQDCRREHCLAETFAADIEVRRQWIRYWSQEVSPIERANFDDETVKAACAGHNTEERVAFLAEVNAKSPICGELIYYLVFDDPVVFAELLHIESLAEFRLAPLRRLPNETWVRLAQVAIDDGVPEERIARSSGMGSSESSDTVEDRCQTEIHAWDEIIRTHDGAIKRIARRRRAERLDALKGMDE